MNVPQVLVNLAGLRFLSLLFLFCLVSSVSRAQSAGLVFAEEQASPVGGLDAFYRHVSESIQYPEEARQAGIQGRVYVEFIVDRAGNLSDVQIQRGIGGGCDEEAVRLVKTFTAGWQPARAGGKAISVQMSLPIRFVRETAQAAH
jgi:TonB family protein